MASGLDPGTSPDGVSCLPNTERAADSMSWQPTITSQEAWFQDMLSLLPENIPNYISSAAKEAFLQVPLLPFLKFESWACQNNVSNPFGFNWEALRQTDPARSMRQPKASTTQTVIDANLSPRQHLEAALALPSPYARDVVLEKDLQFAVQQAVQQGLGIQQSRDEAFAAFRMLARALKPIDSFLLEQRHVQHVPGFRPALVAACVSILKWPDRSLPTCLCQGFPLVGPIPPSGIFRPTTSGELPEIPLLGVDAASYVDDLEVELRIHPSAILILEESIKEQQIGLLGPFQSREHFDALFGRGQWRPLKRHTIHQHDKERPIDDGKAGRRNECTQLQEAIVNQRPDFPLAVIKFWCRTALSFIRSAYPHSSAADLPQHMPWFRLVAGTEDLWKGYRQNHPVQQHMCVNIITFVHPRTAQRVYAQLFRLPFGLASAVNQFNRAPQLFTAVARRIFHLVAGHYFDDSIQFEYEQLAGTHKNLFVRMLDMFGVIVGHHKRQHMSTMPRFLGLLTDFSLASSNHTVSLQCCPTTKARAMNMLSQFLSTCKVTSGQAAKARGLLNWLEMSMLGRPLTAAFSGLIARQYYEASASLTPALALCVQYLQLALSILPSRIVDIYQNPRPPVIIYTDASTEAPTALGFRLGIWIALDGRILVSSVDVPQAIVDAWAPRRTYINLLELLAVPLLAFSEPEILKDRDVLWFLDNQAAWRAIIRSASSVSDVNHLSLLAGLQFAKLRCNPWFEWVPSHQNLSDPLSRQGWADPEVAAAIQAGTWTPLVLSLPGICWRLTWSPFLPS